MKTSKVNYGKIFRDILKEQTGLDTRFTTKIVKSKKAYKREKFDYNKILD